MKLSSSILALAVIAATAGAASAAGTAHDRTLGALAPATSATTGDPVALGHEIRAAAKGQRHDAARFRRLMALVRDPRRSATAMQRWASRGGGAGMGQPMWQPAQPPGTISQHGTTSPYGTMPDLDATTSTPRQQGAIANPPAATDGTTTTTSGGGNRPGRNATGTKSVGTTGSSAAGPSGMGTTTATTGGGGGGTTQGTMAAPRITSVASIIGDDPQAVRTFVQALGANRARLAELQASLRSPGALGLAPGTVDVGTIVGIEVVPGTGGLEIYTVP